MMDTKKILLDKELNPESKVWLIASELHEANMIWDDLWYAILEMKDKHWKDICTDATMKYLPFIVKEYKKPEIIASSKEVKKGCKE